MTMHLLPEVMFGILVDIFNFWIKMAVWPEKWRSTLFLKNRYFYDKNIFYKTVVELNFLRSFYSKLGYPTTTAGRCLASLALVRA